MDRFTFLTCHLLILFSNIDFGLAKPSVLIVGAGSAGISAAVKLLEKDITDILILESSNRIGGRIYSVPLGDGMVDLGPRHCNGVRNSVCYDTTKDLNILRVSPFASDIFHPKKQRLSEKDKRNVFDMLSSWLEIKGIGRVVLENSTLGEYSNKRHSYTFDTNFYGCYGYQTVESRRGVSANLQLAESLYCGDKPVVLFAGDMTHPTRFQSVNGASETGFRAAKIISEYTAKTENIPLK